ncbi:hypothetical protein [Chryseobacterium gleum]|uniref:hypothetical protein n=1 Tax=Chryseobacterium gleum TaxID=250 RepID=UPI00289A721F|nr:hypothetical protein [Chryseobacterium gleum]
MKGIEYSLICKVYLEGDIAVKYPIIGLIFPEKLEFDGIINFGLQIKTGETIIIVISPVM